MGLIGFAGSSLRLDLDTLRWKAEELNESSQRKYLGGTSYAARLLYDEQRGGIDPLSPEAMIVLATGPLTRNSIPGGGSIELCFKSPLTGGWGESRAGSDFGPDLRRSGFDHLVIRGRAKEPTWLVIHDGQVEFRSASPMVGMTVSAKHKYMRGELPAGKWSLCCIGKGGENLVKFANVMFDDRAAGRGGAGAVFGSKNLLAIAVRGSVEPGAAEPERLTALLREAFSALGK
ncbi:MAG: aldehyde ferredoxin oxidoreductase N-terminal domain-containing protein, partial [Spirochaetota bacterium]